MGPISKLIWGVLILVALSEGKPQIGSEEPAITANAPMDPSATSLVSPWAQWFSLKAPPIPGLPMGGKSKKKKLLPGPPPPEGTMEAPWVTWTRLHLATALSPTGPGIPPSPPPPPPSTPDGSPAPSDSSSPGEPSVWIQWTQMKLPMTSPLAPADSTAQTPWDAWTSLKSPIAPVAPLENTPSSPGLVRRMAPDRYSIVSTVAPRLTGWPPASLSSQQNSQGQAYAAPSGVPVSPSQVGSLSSSRPTFLDVLNATPSNNVPNGNLVQMPASFTPQQINVLQSQVAPIASNAFPESLSAALRPIPHQIVSQIVEKATPEELIQVILAISQAQEQASPESISVQQVLPSTLVAKLPDELTPLLDSPINITPPSLNFFPTPTQLQYAVPLALIPEPTRTTIVSIATPQELTDVISTLAKIEALPASEQAPVAGVPVASILPSSLQAKLPPIPPSVKLVPPVLLTLPTPAIEALLPIASPSEVSVLVANAAKLEKMPSLVPRPPLGALLPPSLASKAPNNIAPLLKNPVPVQPAVPKQTAQSPLNALPAPLPKILLAKASPSEVETIKSAITVLQVAAPLIPITSPPRALNLLPHSILTKVPPQILPALTKPITLTPPIPSKEVTAISTVLAAIEPLVLKQIVSVATPVELAEIKQKVISKTPLTTPIISILPVSLVSKLPPQALPALNKVVTIPAVPPVTLPTPVVPTILGVSPTIVSTVTTALSKLPEPVLSTVLGVATPDEISKIAQVINQLKTAAPAEKPLISKLEVATILPPTLMEKLSPEMLPELSVPVVISTLSSPEALPTIIPGVPPQDIETISAALAAVPPPVVTELLTKATPVEVEALVDTITKLENLSPAEIELAEKVEVNSILPASLIAKLPPSLVPLLAVPVTIPKVVSPPSIPDISPTLLASITPALSAAPPEVVSEIISVATPVEINELAGTISKLEALPLDTPLLKNVLIKTILPETLFAKLPPSLEPLLNVPVTINPPPTVSATPTMVPVIPGVPPNLVENIVSALTAVPTPIVTKILSVATPSEIAEVAETLKKLEDLPPSDEKLEVETVLPPSLVAKIPPTVLPLLRVPLTIQKVAPPLDTIPATIPVVPGVPPTLVNAIIPALAAVPMPIVTKILSVATLAELTELAETITKLEELPPSDMALTEKLDVQTILPPSLVAKIPPTVLPLLSVPLTIQKLAPTLDTIPATIPVVPGVPPTLVNVIIPALAAVPMPIVTIILSVATPVELAELAETITKLEELPPSDMALTDKLEVETILPPSLVAKIPPTVLPLLSVPLTIQKLAPTLDTIPATIPVVPGVPPTLVNVIIPAMAAVPMPIVTKILSVASPAELTELAETIKALEKLPPTQVVLAEKLDVDTILPTSLTAKIPPSVLPLLRIPVTISKDTTPSVPAPTSIPIVPGVPPTLVEAVSSALAAVPMPVVTKILSIATSTELAQLAETIKSLEELLPAEALLAEKLEVETVLPASLVAKIPPTVLPLLNVPITIPKVLPPAPVVIPIIPGVPATVVETIVPALSAVPQEVISEILSVATPVELTELADIITKLEALPPTEPILSELAVQTILPPTLVAKLPPAVFPALSKPLTLTPADEVPPPAPSSTEPVIPAPVITIPGIPPSITSVVIPPLSSLPPPVITKILTTATPSELSQLVDTMMKLEALTPEEKTLASVLDVGTVLPPSLVAKLPASMVPMLDKPVQISGSVPEVPGVTPSPVVAPGATPTMAPDTVLPDIIESILPALSALPPPVISTLVNVATPSELAQLADAVKELEAVPPLQLPLLSGLPVETIIPEPLLARLPSQVLSVLATTPLKISPPVVPQAASLAPLPPVISQASETIPPAEEKVLTKWAKVILEKTGKPALAPIPGEIPPLQAAWMEWIQLKVNASKTAAAPAPATTTASPSLESESSTEYPWTQWLKLKGNTTTTEPALPSSVPLLDVTTESPEKELLDWLETLEKPTESPPPSIPSLPVSPETEALVIETLKDLGIEAVDLPPEQLNALLAEVEKNIAVASISPTPVKDEIPPSPISGIIPPSRLPSPIPPPSDPNPSYPFPYYSPYMPYLAPKPFSPFLPPPSYLVPSSPLPPSPPPPSSPTASTVPTLNLTEYLVSNSMIPKETSPSASIPIPTLTKLLTDNNLASTITRNITAEELSSLTPTKFAALLKQILQDCRDNATTNSTLATRAVYPNRYASYYKSKYSPAWRGKRSPSPALYPIPNQAFNPTTPPTTSMDSLPLPKVETAGTVLDPAYWAAQKSMFLSKLFSTLAKVALNDSQAGDNQGTTQSPKQQLANQVNTVLLSDMTRSVHHRPPKKQKVVVEEEDSSEDPAYDYQGDQSSDDDDTQNNFNVQSQSHDLNQNEKELVNNDNSEPDLPKEPDNPLHKLFKFGVQKTILSDLTTPAPAQQPIYIYVTPDPSYYPVPMATPPDQLDNYKKPYNQSHKKVNSKKKKRPQQQQQSSNHNQKHHHGSSKSQSNQQFNRKPTRFRLSSTTTENPVDFDLLAKALLLDDTTGNGPKAGGRK